MITYCTYFDPNVLRPDLSALSFAAVAGVVTFPPKSGATCVCSKRVTGFNISLNNSTETVDDERCN